MKFIILINFTLILCPEVFSNNIHRRIFGGKNATRNSAPWMISFQRWDKHRCGGSLLDKEWILTAAHCIYNEKVYISESGTEKFTAIAGEYDLMSIKGTEQVRFIDRLISHPGYVNSTALENDIGLIHVSKPFDINDFVQIIPLPSKSESTISGEATLFGWGALNDKLTMPNILQTIKLQIIENGECAKFSDEVRVEVLDSQFCAVSNGAKGTACQGDSGSGLIQHNILIGVASFGYACNITSTHTGFTRVSSYIDWIQSTMNQTDFF